MALLSCPECNNMVSEHASQCPHCGIDKETMQKLTNKSESIIVGDTLIRYVASGDTYIVPEGIKEITNLCSAKNIYINAKCEKINTSQVGDIENIYVDKNNNHFESVDGVLFSKDLKTLILYPNMRTDREFVLPIYTETIGYCAFKNNKFLRCLTCSRNLKEIQYGGTLKIEAGFTFIGDCNRSDRMIVSMPGGVKNLNYTYEYNKFIGKATPVMKELHDMFDRINVEFEFI